MHFMPDHLHNLEEWILWLLKQEFSNRATPSQLAQRTGFDPSSVEAAILVLENSRDLAVWKRGTVIEEVKLTPQGQRSYFQLKEGEDKQS